MGNEKRGAWIPDIKDGYWIYRCSGCGHEVRGWHKHCLKCKQENYIRVTSKA